MNPCVSFFVLVPFSLGISSSSPRCPRRFFPSTKRTSNTQNVCSSGWGSGSVVNRCCRLATADGGVLLFQPRSRRVGHPLREPEVRAIVANDGGQSAFRYLDLVDFDAIMPIRSRPWGTATSRCCTWLSTRRRVSSAGDGRGVCSPIRVGDVGGGRDGAWPSLRRWSLHGRGEGERVDERRVVGCCRRTAGGSRSDQYGAARGDIDREVLVLVDFVPRTRGRGSRMNE